MYLGPEKIIEKKKEYLCPPSFMNFYKNPPQIVKGKMQYLFDENGKSYLDLFAGVSVMNCGHSNEFILDATINQLKELQHTSIIYLTQPMVELAEKLSSILPRDIKRSFFCCSGSEANETALLMARLHTGKEEIIALNASLHGRTHMTMSVTGVEMWRSDPRLMDNVHFVPNPYSVKSKNLTAEASLKAIEILVEERGDKIAALIAEPIQGNGGIIMPPKNYFKRVKEILEKKGILLIIDEVQTGFGRTGKMFGIEHFDVEPDIITIAKALGNGMPISAACATDKVAMSFNKPSASTLGGNPVSCKTALAVIEYIENNNLVEKSRELGEYLNSKLLDLKEKYSIIYDVRGIGLMQGLELRDEQGMALAVDVDEILELLKDSGIILGKNGLERNVLAFQPPLIITTENIDFAIIELDKALKFVSKL